MYASKNQVLVIVIVIVIAIAITITITITITLTVTINYNFNYSCYYYNSFCYCYCYCYCYYLQVQIMPGVLERNYVSLRLVNRKYLPRSSLETFYVMIYGGKNFSSRSAQPPPHTHTLGRINLCKKITKEKFQISIFFIFPILDVLVNGFLICFHFLTQVYFLNESK